MVVGEAEAETESGLLISCEQKFSLRVMSTIPHSNSTSIISAEIVLESSIF